MGEAFNGYSIDHKSVTELIQYTIWELYHLMKWIQLSHDSRSARLQWNHCYHTGVMAVLHSAMILCLIICTMVMVTHLIVRNPSCLVVASFRTTPAAVVHPPNTAVITNAVRPSAQTPQLDYWLKSPWLVTPQAAYCLLIRVVGKLECIQYMHSVLVSLLYICTAETPVQNACNVSILQYLQCPVY